MLQSYFCIIVFKIVRNIEVIDMDEIQSAIKKSSGKRLLAQMKSDLQCFSDQWLSVGCIEFLI